MLTKIQTRLSDLHMDEGGVVVSFTTGHAEASRLASLGITPGARVAMTQNFGRGPLIVTVRGTHIALGRGEAACICVERNGE